MKKSWKWLATALLFSSMAFTSCVPPFVDSSNSESSTDSSGTEAPPKVDTTITDAWDENRPNFDDMFDYGSGYKPTTPVDPNTKFTVSIAGAGPVSFTDGSKVKEFSAGETLTKSNFDLSKLGDARAFKGFVLVNEDGSTGSAVDLDSSIRVMQNLTVAPYFDVESGFTAMSLGSGKNTKYNTDQVPGDFTAHTEEEGVVSIKSNQVVQGGENGYGELGTLIKDSKLIRAGSAIRFDTKYDSALTADTVVEFAYNFENKGKDPIHVSVYNISASAEYKKASGYYAYESRYRIDVDLEPGESMSAKAQYLLGANGNALTYIVYDRDANTTELGVSLSYKIVEGAAAPTNPTQDSYDKANAIAVTLKLPENFTVAEAPASTQVVGKKFILPAVEDINNTTGKKFTGWTITKKDGSVLTAAAGESVSYDQDVTIEPALMAYATVELQLPTGITVTGYAPQVSVGDTFVLPTDAQTANTTNKRISGWYLVGDESQTPIVEGETVITAEKITIAPILVDKEYANVTVQTPDGFTVTGYETEQLIGVDVKAPTAEQITNTTGRELLGWYMKNADGVFVSLGGSEDKALPAEGVTIYPALSDKEYALTVNNNTSWAVADAGAVYPATGSRDGYTNSKTFNTNDFTEEFVVASSNALVKENWFRLNTKYSDAGFINGRSYDISYALTNHGKDEISFVLYHCTNGWDITGENKDYTPTKYAEQSITLAPGQTTYVEFVDFEYTHKTGTKNFLSVFVVKSAIPSLALGVRMNVEEVEVEVVEQATVKVHLPDGLTLSSDYTGKFNTGDTLVVPTAAQILGTPADGRTLLGWYVVGSNEKVTDATKIYDSEMTIAPYWSKVVNSEKLAGITGANAQYNGQDIVFGNSQGDLKPNNLSNLSSSNFVAIPSKYTNTEVIDGGTGYAELGTIAKYNGTMPVGAKFRYITIVNASTAVVATNTNHTFVYTFQNFGEGKISLSMQAVNSGTDAEGPVSTIVLNPGESTQITFTVAYAKGGTNKNVMAYFTVTEEMNGMNLGAAVSVILNSDQYKEAEKEDAKINVTLPDGITVSGYNPALKVGDCIILPKAEQITNTTNQEILGWYIVGDESKTPLVDGETEITEREISIAPILKTKAAKVTLILPENVTTEGYAAEIELGGNVLAGLPTSEQLVGLEREILGWYYVKNGAEISADETVTSQSELKIAPYFGAASGYNALSLGSGANNRYNTDQVPGDFTTHAKAGKVTVATDEIISGGTGYAEKGIVITDKNAIGVGSAIRFDTKYTTKLSATSVVEFLYNFENKGSAPIHISVYHISGSSEYKTAGGYYGYESRYRMDVILNAGESTHFAAQYLLASNGNALTYMVFEKDAASLELGVSIAYKVVTGATAPTNPTQEALARETATLTMQAPAGFSVSSDYVATYPIGKRITAPTDAQITNTTGRALTGWYLKKTDGTFVDLSVNPLMPTGGGVVMPVLASHANELSINSTANPTTKPDYFGKDGVLYTGEDAAKYDSFSKGTLYSEGSYSVQSVFYYDGTLTAGEFIRLKTGYTVESTKKYDFKYIFTNHGTEEIKFTVYQLTGGYVVGNSKASQQVTLAAGASLEVALNAVSLTSNGNLLTMLVFENEISNFALGINMQVSQAA